VVLLARLLCIHAGRTESFPGRSAVMVVMLFPVILPTLTLAV
jgi:hypothetical protein